MRTRTPLLIRGLVICVMAFGLMSTMTLSAAAQEICREEPFLAAADGDGDGVVSTAEIRSVNPDNARLQDLAGRLEAQGVTGIRYTGCDGGTGDAGTGDGGTGTGNGVEASGSGTNGSATGDGVGTGANASGDGGSTGTGASGAGGGETSGDTTEGTDDVVITDMPSVGQGTSTVSGWDATVVTLLVGAASIMTLAGALTLRRRWLV